MEDDVSVISVDCFLPIVLCPLLMFVQWKQQQTLNCGLSLRGWKSSISTHFLISDNIVFFKPSDYKTLYYKTI